MSEATKSIPDAEVLTEILPVYTDLNKLISPSKTKAHLFLLLVDANNNYLSGARGLYVPIG